MIDSASDRCPARAYESGHVWTYVVREGRTGIVIVTKTCACGADHDSHPLKWGRQKGETYMHPADVPFPGVPRWFLRACRTSLVQPSRKAGPKWLTNDWKIARKYYGKDPCVWCGQFYPVRDMTTEHIEPRLTGGARGWENEAPACKWCNNGRQHTGMLRYLLRRLMDRRAMDEDGGELEQAM